MTRDLQAIYQQHEAMLKLAVSWRGFRTLPQGAKEAIEAGLVTESDPTWQYSDAPGAANGLALTDHGREVVGTRFACACPPCSGYRDPYLEVRYCPSCDAGLRQYGPHDIDGEPGCGFHCIIVKGVRTVAECGCRETVEV